MHRGANEKRERTGSIFNANLVECQPNSAAPLLRDEKGRREWIEHELDMSCQVAAYVAVCFDISGNCSWDICAPQHMWRNACTCPMIFTTTLASVSQSFELARILEGEKAQRGEVARKLADISRRLAQASASGDAAASSSLNREKVTLEAAMQKLSSQVRTSATCHVLTFCSLLHDSARVSRLSLLEMEELLHSYMFQFTRRSWRRKRL